MQGVLGQTSEGMQWVWGESKAKGFDGEVNAIEWGGNARSFTANKQMQGVLEQTSEGTQWVWGESNAKGYGGRTLLKEGKCKEFYSK